MGGKPKKNPILNALNGNPGQRKAKAISKIGDKRKDGFILKVPAKISKKIAKRARVIAEYLHNNKISQRIDESAFDRYCFNLEFIEQAIQNIFEHGIVVLDRNGSPKKNPAIQIQKENGIAAAMFETKYLGEPLARDLFTGDNESGLSSYLKSKSA